ncbi:hypothetical protein A2U01_0029330, partial [Trifolium medium]|nr:hypothetical protein [Trifolium medium]
LKSKGDETTQTKSDAGSHLLLVQSVAGENKYDWQDKVEKIKHLEEKQNIQGGQVIVPGQMRTLLLNLRTYYWEIQSPH